MDEIRKKTSEIRKRIFRIRIGMITRCYNPDCNNYHGYGDRGIRVCDEWLNNKESFYKWALENGFDFGLQLDRINPDGNYEPSNCRFITSRENNNNRRNNVRYEIGGISHTLTEWMQIYKIPITDNNYRKLRRYIVEYHKTPKAAFEKWINDNPNSLTDVNQNEIDKKKAYEKATKDPKPLTKEQEIRRDLLRKFQHMKGRCYNPNEISYSHYGGRGIGIQQSWLDDPEKFVEWSINNGYKKGLSIDRIDVNKNYSEDNCRYVDNYVQANNKSNVKLIEYQGRKQSLKSWCKELDLDYGTIWARIASQGWSVERAFNTPIREFFKKYLYKGNYYTLAELSELSNISESTLRQRIEKEGCSVEEAINNPIQKINFITINNITKSFTQWCKDSGISRYAAMQRIQKGFPIELALTIKSFKDLKKEFEKYLKDHPDYGKKELKSCK